MSRRGAAAIVAAVMIVATGCGSSTVADPSSPVPIMTTPHPTSSTPTAPTTAASPTSTLDPNSDGAIIAAVHAYAAALTRVASTATLAPLATVAIDGCPCLESEASLVNQLRAKGQHLDVAIVTMSARVTKRSASNADVDVVLSNGPFHVRDASDAVVAVGKAATLKRTLSFQRRGDEWLVFYAR